MFDHYAKAVVGALLAGLGALLPSLSTGHVTATQWVLIVIASLSTLAGVWATPNSTVLTQAQLDATATDALAAAQSGPGIKADKHLIG